MSDEQKPSPPSGKEQAKDTREAKLAAALRANLRRRKAAATQGPERAAEDGDA